MEGKTRRCTRFDPSSRELIKWSESKWVLFCRVAWAHLRMEKYVVTETKTWREWGGTGTGCSWWKLILSKSNFHTNISNTSKLNSCNSCRCRLTLLKSVQTISVQDFRHRLKGEHVCYQLTADATCCCRWESSQIFFCTPANAPPPGNFLPNNNKSNKLHFSAAVVPQSGKYPLTMTPLARQSYAVCIFCVLVKYLMNHWTNKTFRKWSLDVLLQLMNRISLIQNGHHG